MLSIVKILTSSFIILLVSEASKKSTLLSSLLISLPIISILSFVWIYIETKDVVKIAEMSYSVFWLVIPSLAFFLVLPFMLNKGFSFIISISVACALTSILYIASIMIIKHFNS